MREKQCESLSLRTPAGCARRLGQGLSMLGGEIGLQGMNGAERGNRLHGQAVNVVAFDLLQGCEKLPSVLRRGLLLREKRAVEPVAHHLSLRARRHFRVGSGAVIDKVC